MTIINSINNTRFSFNGIEYLRNYISVVRGDRVEIFNCYEQEDVLLCLTHYNQITLNGTIHTSVANLHSALQNVIYSRSTLSGENVEIIDQNNIGKVIHLGYLSSQNFSTEVPQRINALSTTLTATDSPVFFTGYYTSPTGNQKLTYQFMGGKGNWLFIYLHLSNYGASEKILKAQVVSISLKKYCISCLRNTKNYLIPTNNETN